jgi:hypothetical protein
MAPVQKALPALPEHFASVSARLGESGGIIQVQENLRSGATALECRRAWRSGGTGTFDRDGDLTRIEAHRRKYSWCLQRNVVALEIGGFETVIEV